MYTKKSNYKPYEKYQKKPLNTSEIEKNRDYFYTELCQLLKEPVFKKGNQRNGQLKHWKRYFKFNYDKEHNIIEVLDVYDEPLPEEKQTRNKPKKYNDDILTICLLTKNCYLKKSMSSLQHYWGFFNNEYTNAHRESTSIYNSHYSGDDEVEWRRWKLSQNRNLTLFYFFVDCSKALYRIFNDALKYLQQNGFRLKDKAKIYDTKKGITENNGIVYGKTCYPEKEDKFNIAETQDKILGDYNCKTISDIYKKGIAHIYFRRFYNALREYHDIYYAYKEYQIKPITHSVFYSFKAIYDRYKELYEKSIKDSNKALSELSPAEIEDLIITSSIFYNDSNKFLKDNNLIFANKEELINELNARRYTINKKVVERIKKNNKKAVENFKQLLITVPQKNPIVKSLKAIYGDISEEEYIIKYEELLDSYVDKYIKLTPEKDKHVQVEINEYYILNEIPALMEKFPVKNYQIFNEIKNGSK